MYLSRVALDMTRRDTMLALQNPSMLHGAVEQSFEPRTSRALWRLDTLGGQYYLLLLSAERPELSHLVAQFGTGEMPETRDYTPLLERMTPGLGLAVPSARKPDLQLLHGKCTRQGACLYADTQARQAAAGKAGAENTDGLAHPSGRGTRRR